MKTPNQGAKTMIFRGLVAFLGCGARCGAAASGEFGSESEQTRAVEAVFGARPAKWRIFARISGAESAVMAQIWTIVGAISADKRAIF